MRRIIMLLTVALVMGAMMVAMAAPAFAAGALFLASDQGTILQVTPQTTTQDTITKTLIPVDPYRVCQPNNPYKPPVCPTIT
jgi:hypothetical protein